MHAVHSPYTAPVSNDPTVLHRFRPKTRGPVPAELASAWYRHDSAGDH